MIPRTLPADRLRLQNWMQELGVRPKKGLGQHFLVDRRVLKHILDAAQLAPEDVVVEVGPGLGTLTRELALRAGRVIAVELDARLATALARYFQHQPQVHIVHGDARELDLEPLLNEGTPYKVVANLPYYAANTILRSFLEARRRPERLVIMVQREVAQSIAAPPGKMGLLSVSVQLYGRPQIVTYVPPGSFYPPPKVTSAVVRIDVYPRPLLPLDHTAPFFDLVRAGFSAPRKQLRNALSQGLGRPHQEVQTWLVQAGLDPKRRAETLSLEEWGRLYAAAVKSLRQD